jgi:hypothetical protein
MEADEKVKMLAQAKLQISNMLSMYPFQFKLTHSD